MPSALNLPHPVDPVQWRRAFLSNRAGVSRSQAAILGVEPSPSADANFELIRTYGRDGAWISYARCGTPGTLVDALG